MESATEQRTGTGRIRSLSASDSRLILATQQFPDPHRVISALLENSLDAGATEIAVVLEGAGIRSITVNDNGHGIDLATLQTLGTCRITTASSQSNVGAHKGESIFLISALGTVLITSSTGDDPYERVVSEDACTARHATRVGVGTTVVIQSLYEPVPVRQKYFSLASPRKKLLLSITEAIQSYALANYTLGFRLVMDEIAYVDVRSAPRNTIHERYIELFGQDLGSLVGFFSLETRLGYDVKASLAGPDTGVTKHTKLGHARKLFLSTNGRPVLCPTLIEAIQQTYARITATHIPIGALNLTLPPGTYTFMRSTPYDTLQMQGLDTFAGLLSEEYLAWLLRHDKSIAANSYPNRSASTKTSVTRTAKGSSVSSLYLKSRSQSQSQHQDVVPASAYITRLSHTKAEAFFHTQNSRPQQMPYAKANADTESCHARIHPMLGTIGTSVGQAIISCSEQSDTSGSSKVIKVEPQPCDSEGRVRIGSVRKRGPASGFRQSNFANLKYICQYNQSFLLAQLDDTFFLIDQHAAHEAKYFSDYWHNPQCYLSKQKTIAPLKLELRPDEKLCLEEFLSSTLFDIIGFEPRISGEYALLSAFPSLFGQTLTEDDFREYLLLLYGHTREYIESILRISEAEEKSREKMLVRILHNNIAPPRIRKIFASKSCKASVRLGDPLLDSTAKRIIADLAYCEKPFNCPHGRPVLRFLDLTSRSVSTSEEPIPPTEDACNDIINSED